jgi:CRP-like cAMP-binding protein
MPLGGRRRGGGSAPSELLPLSLPDKHCACPESEPEPALAELQAAEVIVPPREQEAANSSGSSGGSGSDTELFHDALDDPSALDGPAPSSRSKHRVLLEDYLEAQEEVANLQQRGAGGDPSSVPQAAAAALRFRREVESLHRRRQQMNAQESAAMQVELVTGAPVFSLVAREHPEFIRSVAGRLRGRVFEPGQALLVKGAPAREMFIVLSGSVEVYNRLFYRNRSSKQPESRSVEDAEGSDVGAQQQPTRGDSSGGGGSVSRVRKVLEAVQRGTKKGAAHTKAALATAAQLAGEVLVDIVDEDQAQNVVKPLATLHAGALVGAAELLTHDDEDDVGGVAAQYCGYVGVSCRLEQPRGEREGRPLETGVPCGY